MPKPKGKKILTSRWIFKIKQGPNGGAEKYKTRLVACGHTQQKGIDYEEVFAPVDPHGTSRLERYWLRNEEMYVDQMDVI